MQVRCPHCHSTLQLDDYSSLAAVDCKICGSSFSLLDDDTIDFRDESDTTERAAPKRVGHFELLEVVGRGAFGTVWRATDLELQRTVAVKIPRQDKLDPDEAEKFLREARAAAQLHHPNIVAVHEVGREDDAVYIVSDFVKGVTLSRWLSARKVSPREAAKLAAKVADGLDHAHQAGVIHRDLKPSNVMLDEHDEPFIMDFGLAKRESNDATMTMDGYVMGTPSYMPPEQARGQAHHADQRSDVYSLGAILFETLSGEKPFRGNARMVLHQVLHDDAPHPRKLDSRIPEDLDTICLKCLEKSPAKRYETASELADELQRFLRGEPIRARRITSVARTWRWGKRNPAVSLLAIGLLLALLVGLAGVTTQWLRVGHHAKVAEEAADREREAHTQTNRTLYVAHMNMVQHAFELRDSARMISILNLHRERTAEDDPRGFEWYYWWRASHPWAKSFDGHSGSVFAVAVSSDGTRVASAGMDRVVRVRDISSGKEVAAFDTHEQAVFAIAFSPDATQLASAGRDGVIRIWNLHDGQEATTLAGHEGTVFSLTFSPDGESLVSGGSDLEVRLWNVDSGERIHELSGHFDFVYTVAFAPDGEHIASAGLDRTVRVWDARSGEQVQLIEGNKSGGHDIEVWSVAFSPDGKTLATASGDKTIKLWEVASGNLIDTLEGHSDRVRSLLFADTGKKLISVGQDRTLRLWDLTAEDPELPVPVRRLDRTPIHFFERMAMSTGKLVRTLPAHAGPVLCIAASKNGDVIATGGDDGRVKLWEMSEIERTDTFDEHKRSVNCVDFSADGSKLATAGNDNSVRLRDAVTGKTIGDPRWHDERVLSVDFSPDGKRIASGDFNGTVTLWELIGGERRVIGTHAQAVSSVSFSPDGKTLATVSHDAQVKLWDVASGNCLHTLGEHEDRLYAVRFAHQGEYLLSAGSEGEIILWKAADGKIAWRIKAHDKRIWALAVSPTANVVASASDDRSIKLWSLEDGECLGELLGHAEGVLSLTYSPDGKTLVSGSSDKTVKLWDMVTSEPKTTLKGHRYRVWSVAFSPDGGTLASSSYALKLWRAAEPDRLIAAQ